MCVYCAYCTSYSSLLSKLHLYLVSHLSYNMLSEGVVQGRLSRIGPLHCTKGTVSVRAAWGSIVAYFSLRISAMDGHYHVMELPQLSS